MKVKSFLRRKLLIAISVAIVCLFALEGCFFLNNKDENDENSEYEKNVSRYFDGKCPLSVSGTIDGEITILEFENISEKDITVYVGGIICFETMEKMIKNKDGTKFSCFKQKDKIKAESSSSSFKYTIDGKEKAKIAMVYMYYVEYSDGTSWGKEILTEDQISDYGETFLILLDLSKYYSGDCEVSLLGTGSDESCIVGGEILLSFINESDKPIIAFEAVMLQYNVYGQKLQQTSSGSAYGKIVRAPIDFNSGKSDFCEYRAYSNTSYAEIYVYYVLYNDQTSWGTRENVSGDQAVRYGMKYRVDRVG